MKRLMKTFCLVALTVLILISFASAEGTWTTYTTEDGLADNDVISIAAGSDGVIWAANVYGTSSYDGTAWTTYTREEMLIENIVITVEIDKDNVKWFGSDVGELSSFDGTVWKSYSEAGEFSSSPNNYIEVAVDENNVKWFGIDGGVCSFDGSVWTKYYYNDDANYNFQVESIAIDNDGVIWIGTYMNGLISFDPEPQNIISSQNVVPETISILGVYPNPFNPATTISFTIPASGFTKLVIYNISGQKVRELVLETMTAGMHNVMWDGRSDNGSPVSSGIYFSRLTMGERTASGRMLLVK